MSALIKPKRSGLALATEIAEASPPSGGLCVWWLGQSGFVIKSPSSLLVIDPYLSDSLTLKYAATDRPHVRMTELVVEPALLTGVDLILCSHKHTDHMDASTLLPMLEVNTSGRVVLPAALMDYAQSIGLPGTRMVGALDGQAINLAGFQIEPIPSAHEALDIDVLGRHLYMGYAVSYQGLRLYHSGDGILYPGLVERLSGQTWDVLFLPINGRDSSRGVPGNMSAADAVDVACALKPRFLVPHHYDMFTFNTVPIEQFVAEARRLPPGVEARILKCGERWELES